MCSSCAPRWPRCGWSCRSRNPPSPGSRRTCTACSRTASTTTSASRPTSRWASVIATRASTCITRRRPRRTTRSRVSCTPTRRRTLPAHRGEHARRGLAHAGSGGRTRSTSLPVRSARAGSWSSRPPTRSGARSTLFVRRRCSWASRRWRRPGWQTRRPGRSTPTHSPNSSERIRGTPRRIPSRRRAGGTRFAPWAGRRSRRCGTPRVNRCSMRCSNGTRRMYRSFRPTSRARRRSTNGRPRLA